MYWNIYLYNTRGITKKVTRSSVYKNLNPVGRLREYVDGERLMEIVDLVAESNPKL